MKRTTSARVAPIHPRSNQYPLNDLESSAPLQPKEAPYDTGLGRKKQPFWRTTKGIVILGLVLLAIILAAVLGGVLGSRNHKNLSANNGAGAGGGNGSSGGNSTNDGGDGISGVSATNNGGDGVSGTLPSATISSQLSATSNPQLPTTRVRHSATPTQEVIGTATGSTTGGDSGTTVSSGSDGSGSQPGASTGANTTVGDTGAAQPPGDSAVPATF